MPSGSWESVHIVLTVGALVVAFATLVHHRGYRRRTNAAMDERDLLFECIEVTPTPFALYDKGDRLVAWNQSYRELHEPAFSRLSHPAHYGDLMREVARQTLPPEQVEAAVAAHLDAQASADGSPRDRRYPNGRWLRVTKKRTRSGGIAGFASDITELKQREQDLEEKEARFRALAESLPAGIWHVDAFGEPLYANPALLRLLDVPSDSARPLTILSGLLDEVTTRILTRRIAGLSPERFELRAGTFAGHERYLLVVVTEWLCGAREGESCIASIVDVTEQRTARARIEHIANHDPLTGLGNRMRFASALDAAISQARANDGSLTLLAIDLDHFKEVNDRFGHAAGDTVLTTSADRMRSVVSDRGLICRLGGDEFAVLVPGLGDAGIDLMAAELVRALSAPIVIGLMSVEIGASIGIARSPDDADTADRLLRCADMALYEVKRDGRRGVARSRSDVSRVTNA